MYSPKSFDYVDGTAIDASGDIAGYGQLGKSGIATISGPSGGSVPLSGFTTSTVANVTQSYATDASSTPLNRSSSRSVSATMVGYAYESGSGNSQNYNPALWHATVIRGRVSSVSKPVELGTDYNDPAGGTYGSANSINDHGWLVGDAGLDQATPMLWITDNQGATAGSFSAFQLQTLTPNGSPACSFIEASSVNDKGQIVGTLLASTTKFVIRHEGSRLTRHTAGHGKVGHGSGSRPTADGNCVPPSTSNQSIFLLTPTSPVSTSP